MYTEASLLTILKAFLQNTDMKEISLHILDIMQNSVVAEATLVELTVTEDADSDILKFTVKDNGRGMSEEFLKNVIDPFTTSRTTRKVGMGIPLLKLAAEKTGGRIEISSVIGQGTEITAVFGLSHIDRQPLGDMAETILGIVTSYTEVDFVYKHNINGREFILDTREIKEILGGVSLKEPEIVLWLKEFLYENERGLISPLEGE